MLHAAVPAVVAGGVTAAAAAAAARAVAAAAAPGVVGEEQGGEVVGRTHTRYTQPLKLDFSTCRRCIPILGTVAVVAAAVVAVVGGSTAVVAAAAALPQVADSTAAGLGFAAGHLVAGRLEAAAAAALAVAGSPVVAQLGKRWEEECRWHGSRCKPCSFLHGLHWLCHIRSIAIGYREEHQQVRMRLQFWVVDVVAEAIVEELTVDVAAAVAGGDPVLRYRTFRKR